MNKRSMILMLTAVLSAASIAGAQLDPRWTQHDPNRPTPPAITPGQYVEQTPPSDAIVLFDGSNMDQWEHVKTKRKNDWSVKDGALLCAKGSGYLRTKEGFGDCQLHIEWRAPTPATGNGQGRGNSGVFFGGTKYEVQVLDCYENTTYADGWAGAVYGQSPPMVNPCRPPGQWNVYDIIYRRPRFDADGKVTQPATMTVFFNNVLVQEKFVLAGETSYKKRTPFRSHPDRMPISLQDHGNPVAFKNIWVRDLEAAPKSKSQ